MHLTFFNSRYFTFIRLGTDIYGQDIANNHFVVSTNRCLWSRTDLNHGVQLKGSLYAGNDLFALLFRNFYIFRVLIILYFCLFSEATPTG